jgi:sulfur carrier protein
MITVRMTPGDRVLTFDRLNTVLQLLNKLGLGMTDALVARSGVLLTPDRKLRSGDELTVRVVVSRG